MKIPDESIMKEIFKNKSLKSEIDNKLSKDITDIKPQDKYISRTK